MRKQQSNHKGAKRNSKGWRKLADTGHGTEHTRTHTAAYADTWHTMNRSRTSHGAPKGTPSCVGKRKGYRHFGEGGQKKNLPAPSHHRSQQADLFGEQAPLTPWVLSPPHVELSSPEGLQGTVPWWTVQVGQQPPICRSYLRKSVSGWQGHLHAHTSLLWQTSVFGLEDILSKSLMSCDGLSAASFLS